MKKYKFEVETIESGQRRAYGDSFYSYKVTSVEDEWTVKNFCMKVLKNSYEKKDMPDPFVGELIEFEKITNNNDGRDIFDDRSPETYIYKCGIIYL